MAAPPIRSGKDAASIAQTCAGLGITAAEFAQLQRRAAAAKATAYCPYSKFRVGATLLCGDSPSAGSSSGQAATAAAADSSSAGQACYVEGANVENASYPVGTCAERVAFGTAVVRGHRVFRAVAVATDITPPASPCGMCRQFIREFCGLEMPIIMFDKNGDYVVMKLGELLPMSFGPDQLPPPELLA
ncbi:Cytidine deaminase [Escovopsis weberi]|uniref:Cytidine deaminase n=1 Tax=Escovopsis weberi TaxID=150374 RepID=A0A0M8MVG4_ESCWE|nr:Cytidine deaminase [Escovopsis weberi]